MGVSTGSGWGRFCRALAIAALASFCLLAGLARTAQAATDTLFAAPSATGTANCLTPANACTIATAVTDANGAPVSDSVTIELAHGIYALSTPSPTALSITFGGPSLTLQAESGTPTLDGMNTVRLLSVGATSNVTIDGLQIEFGSTTGSGGAIDNSGTLTIKNSTFSNDSAANGGAIADEASAHLTVQDSTLSGNSTTGVGGGAIIDFGAVTVERSAIINNTAPINGGGINVQGAGTTTVANSTIAGNVSTGLGGGMSNLGTLTVEASTITNNSGSSGAAIATGNPNVTFAADIIAAQSAAGACNPANADITDAGYNLDDDGTCISPTSPGPGSHSGTTADGSSTYGAVLDSYLANALGNNGGPTRTAALLNSPNPSTALPDPAFNVVPPSFHVPAAVGGISAACSLSDQRGVVPAAGANCDIGAYLLQATKTSLTASGSQVVQNGSVTYTATVAPSPDGGTVSFKDGPGNPATSQCAAKSVSGGTATCTVSYPKTGTFTVTATYSGDGTMDNDAGSASGSRAVSVHAPAPPPSPSVSKLRLSHRSFTAGGRRVNGKCQKATKRNRRAKPCQLSIKLSATYSLNRAVKVNFKLALKTTGRKVGGRCVKVTHANKHRPKCALLLSAHKAISRTGRTGSNTFSFTGKLPAGTYELTASPAGGAAKSIVFRVTG